MAKRPPMKADMRAPEVRIPAPAEEVPLLKLSDLIQEMLAHNPEIRMFEERWKAAKARVWQAASWDDMMIGVDFEGIPRGRADAGRAENLEWMIQQKIPFPGKKFLGRRVAGKEAKMARADYEAKKREIIAEVKKAYFQYFLKDHEVMLHEETKRTLERLSISAEANYASASGGYSEVLKAHTELAEIINQVARHVQERETALARLNALVGREPMTPLRIAVLASERNWEHRRDHLMELALKNQPEFQAVRYGAQAAKAGAESAWYDLLPDGQVRLEARQFEGEGRIREYDQFYGFEVPVLSMIGRIGKIRERRAEVRAAKAAVENMKNLVLYEVQNALAEYESNDRTVKMYRSVAVPQAESIFSTALRDYESGNGK